MDPRKETVHCRQHGRHQATFVCRHIAESLRTNEAVGFFTADDSDNPRPDAWCTACEKKVSETGGEWTEASDAFADVTLICGRCYDRAKALNSDVSA
jgi:hypothetical protein